MTSPRFDDSSNPDRGRSSCKVNELAQAAYMDGGIVWHRQQLLIFDWMAKPLQTAQASASSPTGGRILIADDSELVRKITRTVLETADFKVCAEAIDGGDAVEKATEVKPDLIILDLAMPEMNGAEAASVLKGLMPHVPIIMFSMHSDCLGPALASTLGVKAIISKADGFHKLIDCVRNLLQAKSEPLPSAI